MALHRSFVPGANLAETDFPLNNLPCGVFSTAGGAPRLGMAIGDQILDVTGAEAKGLIVLPGGPYLNASVWNGLMAAGAAVWAELRAQVTALLSEGAPREAEASALLVAQSDARMHLPLKVAEYTDFYAGKNHAVNVGTMFRGAENALPPNWLHLPIGYNGRASSVVVSGTEVRRPWGQLKGPQDEAPRFAPSARFDIELEMGAIVGTPSTHGRPVTVAEADEMIFGYVLLNDWSARDLQAWEANPMGPFTAKATATTLSPWIVMKAALENFRRPGPERDTPLLPYLREPGPLFYDISLEVALSAAEGPEQVVSQTSSAHLYYASAQQIAHHAISGAPMSVGDVIGSGTISGPEKGSYGSMLELSWGGKEPFELTPGVSRSFLEDGDSVILRGHAAGEGFRIGFGECRGQILPAAPLPDWAREPQ